MRRTFLTLYISRSDKLQTKPLASEMPQQKQTTTKKTLSKREKNKTLSNREKTKPSLLEKKPPSIEDAHQQKLSLRERKKTFPLIKKELPKPLLWRFRQCLR